MDTIAGAATAPGAVATALTMAANDTLQVRKAKEDSRVILGAAWSRTQAVGFTQIRSPQFHDNTRAVRYRNTINQPYNMLPPGAGQPVSPLDTLIVEMTGSAVAGDQEQTALQLLYEDLIGVDGRFATIEEANTNIEDLVTIEATITAAAGPNWTGSEALTAESDLLLGERDYYLFGINFGIACLAAAVRGPDTGFLRCGVPGNVTDHDITSFYFYYLSKYYNAPWIPILNAANKNGTFIEVLQDENAAAVPLNLIMGLVRK